MTTPGTPPADLRPAPACDSASRFLMITWTAHLTPAGVDIRTAVSPPCGPGWRTA